MGLSNELSCKAGILYHCCNPQRFFQSEVLRLYLPALEHWVAQSVSLLSCSFQFIHMQMWDCPLHQLQCHLPQSTSHCFAVSPLHLGCLSLSLLPVWMNVSSLTPWLLDFHTFRFPVSSGCFLNLLLPFFWLCEEAQCIYLCLLLARSPRCEFLETAFR